MSEAFKCFSFLVENVPQWIEILRSLEQKVKERQNEISRIPVPAHKLKKSGSNESIRPRDDDGRNITTPSSGQDIISAPQARDLAASSPSQAAKRKRKTGSIVSNESVPSKYRTRSMIIVYYDSEIQEAFEQLVRNIGTGRNQIRRARMASRMELLTSGAMPDAVLQKPTGPPDAFGLTDIALEKAQSMCEKGAHQFLRDGDCETETSSARESFEEVVRICREELERRAEAEKERQTQEKEVELESPPTTDGIEIGLKSTIEADDGNDDDEDAEAMLDLERIRLMSRARRAGLQ